MEICGKNGIRDGLIYKALKVKSVPEGKGVNLIQVDTNNIF